MSRCPILAAAIVAGYDPDRPVARDFSRPAMYVAPVRKPPRPVAEPRARKTELFEGDCVVCERPFSRAITKGSRLPETCGVKCAAALRWQRSGPEGWGEHHRGFNRGFAR